MQFSSGANTAIIDQDASGNAIFTINSAEKARVTPAGKMTTQEGIQVGDYTKEAACNSAADAGTIRYFSATLELCDGAIWREMEAQ